MAAVVAAALGLNVAAPAPTEVLAATATLGPASAGAPGALPGARTFEPSSAVIANPDRGMYHYTETHFRADGSGDVPLDASTAARWRAMEGVTLVYRVFYLERYAGVDRIDPGDLAKVRADLRAARSAGVKLVVRFAYSADSSQDAPVARVVSHIRQLAPVLNENRAVVAALQAGFVGRWGEWYYSDSFASDPQRPWVLSEADWQARGTILRTLLEATDPSIFVQVRYPSIKQRLLAAAPSALAARVGIHDDCFLGSGDDYGTFAASGDRSWLRDQSRTVPMGGETCAVNAPRSQWPSASADLAAYHWSYLNADYQADVLHSWGPAGLDEVRRRLGYRLRVTGFDLAPRGVTGGSLPVRLTLANDGYAAPFRSRPARLVLRDGTGVVATDVPVDVRTVAPGTQRTFDFTVAMPPRPGSYAVYLALPDPSPDLASDPAYSIRLANVGTWDAQSGWNDLGGRLDVTGLRLRTATRSAGSAPATPAHP